MEVYINFNNNNDAPIVTNGIIYNVNITKLNDEKYTKDMDPKLVNYLKIMICDNDVELNKLIKNEEALKEIAGCLKGIASNTENK